MTNTVRDLLRQDADNVEIPTFDANHVIVQGERRLRRRRLTAVVSAVAAIALIAVGGIVAGSVQHKSQGPVDKPTKTNNDQRNVRPPIREIVWSDDFTELSPGNDTPSTQLGILHVGDREVEIDQVLHSVRFWSMFVTDAGAVYAQDDHSVWFTDGGSPRMIASQTCAYSAGDYESLGLAAGNAGPLIAWFDCKPASRGDLVVYDTSAGHEVSRHRIPSCETGDAGGFAIGAEPPGCVPESIIGDHVYFSRISFGRLFDHQLLDLADDAVQPASQRTYFDDLRAQPRALVIGDTWQTGTPTPATGGELLFRKLGPRLIPSAADEPMAEDTVQTRVFDSVTGQPVRFRLPAGYQPTPTDVGIYFTIFEWLDDDTVALAQGGFNVVGDIIVCHLSDGSCRLAPGPAVDGGIVPTLPLPG